VLEARKHRKRTLDALYAQRKRDCQRIEKEQLEETVGGLDRHNILLKQDNERLEVLLQHAQAQVAFIEHQRASSTTTGTFRGMSQSHQQGNSLQPNSSAGLPAQQEFPVTNLAQREGNPQDQDTSAVVQEQLLALLGAVLQGNTAPASAGTSLDISQLSSILNFEGQQNAESQMTPEEALAAAQQHQQQLVQFINLYTGIFNTSVSASVRHLPASVSQHLRNTMHPQLHQRTASVSSPSFQHQTSTPNPNLRWPVPSLRISSARGQVLQGHRVSAAATICSSGQKNRSCSNSITSVSAAAKLQQQTPVVDLKLSPSLIPTLVQLWCNDQTPTTAEW
jgi:hypothetical protein